MSDKRRSFRHIFFPVEYAPLFLITLLFLMIAPFVVLADTMKSPRNVNVCCVCRCPNLGCPAHCTGGSPGFQGPAVCPPCQNLTPYQTPTSTPQVAQTATPTKTPTKAPTKTSIATVVPTGTTTKTPTKTPINSSTATVYITPTKTKTPNTLVPTKTPTAVANSATTSTKTPTPLPTKTPINSPTSTITIVPTMTITMTMTATPSPAETPLPVPTSEPTVGHPDQLPDATCWESSRFNFLGSGWNKPKAGSACVPVRKPGCLPGLGGEGCFDYVDFNVGAGCGGMEGRLSCEKHPLFIDPRNFNGSPNVTPVQAGLVEAE